MCSDYHRKYKSSCIFYSGIFLLLLGCRSDATHQKVTEVKEDKSVLMKTFICGLWSLGDNNMLNNDGFLFQPDGIVHLVASDYSGNWEIRGDDSLLLSLQYYSTQAETLLFRIDTLSLDQMILTSSEGSHRYRKVPFGMNTDGSILTGFSGSLKPGESREYTFDLISAKEISIELNGRNPSLTFRFFDQDREISSLGLTRWRGILTHGGKYRLELTNNERSKDKVEAEFDLKVIAF